MATNESSNQGSIFIRLDKDSYTPGEQVSGVILLDLKSNHDEPEVWLMISGYEDIKLVDPHLSKKDMINNGSLMNVYEDDQDFFRNKISIYNFAGNFIPAGQYSFPFAFILQAGIPSSFNCQLKLDQNESHARVVYELTAMLESLKVNQIKLAYKLRMPVNQPIDFQERGWT